MAGVSVLLLEVTVSVRVPSKPADCRSMSLSVTYEGDDKRIKGGDCSGSGFLWKHLEGNERGVGGREDPSEREEEVL